LKILTTKELILLNQYVQGVVLKNEIENWFLSFEEVDKQSIVKSIWELATQAQIRESDIPIATINSGLKSTHTPVVIVSNDDTKLYSRGYKLSTLKGTVLKQAFSLVIECFALAEKRRKENEDKLECNHWWHRDLSDEHIVKDILENF